MGRPLIILHGGVGASEMFAPVTPALAEGRQVIAIHLQGHGRTKDIDRPLSFEGMADDIAELIEHLNIEKADIMGYSLGGGVALQTTIRHGDMIRKLVLISTPFKRVGFYPEVLKDMGQMGPDSAVDMKESPSPSFIRMPIGRYCSPSWATCCVRITIGRKAWLQSKRR